MQLIRDFKTFLLRGNVVDLAVAVVIGAAFVAIVNALVKDLLTPLIAAIFGQPSFGNLAFHWNSSTFLYGDFINAVISFVLIAAVLFFLVIKPIELLIQRSRREPTPDPTTQKCPECLSEIPIEARRCAFCTSEIGMAA